MTTNKYTNDEIAALYDLDPDSFKEFVDRYDDPTDEEIEAWWNENYPDSEDEDLEDDMSIDEAVYHTYLSPDCYEAK